MEIAGEETAKCKAAKEVIKSLTAQLKDMAERLPVGASRNINSPPATSLDLISASSDVSNASYDRFNGQVGCQEPESYLSNRKMLSKGLDSQFISNGSTSYLLQNGLNSQLPNSESTISNHSSSHNRLSCLESTTRNGNRTKESDYRNDTEGVEQDEPGVYITLTSLPGGIKDLKRVRFSRKRFSEKEAEQWWAENRVRVYKQYNIRMVDKSSVGVGTEDFT